MPILIATVSRSHFRSSEMLSVHRRTSTCITPADNSVRSVTIRYISFRTINFPSFLLCSFAVLHVT
jgi:hypothetical protein